MTTVSVPPDARESWPERGRLARAPAWTRAVLFAVVDRVDVEHAVVLRAAEHASAVSARVQAARCRTFAGRALIAAGERGEAEAVLQDAEAELAACGRALA